MTTSVVRRLTWLLFMSQSLSSAAFLTSATVGAIAGAQLSGQPALAGLPTAITLLGAAAAAYPAARLMDRFGRRRGLALGLSLGIVGALVAASSLVVGNFVFFLVGFALMGATRGFTDLARYAAAEMVPPDGRARALSAVVLGGTIGAIGGPALVAPTGRLALAAGLDELSGAWFASAVLFSVGLLLIWFLLRPDPSDLGRAFGHRQPGTGPGGPVRKLSQILAQPATRVAIGAMIIGQLVMVMLMSMTSLYMKGHGHSLGDVSIVVTAHALGMFGLSMLAGRLADNFGRAGTIAIGGGLLVLACLLAPLSQSTGVLAVALFTLGLGWNFCYVAGGALLTDSLTLAERSRMQGGADLTVGLISALGSLQSGALFAWLGFARLSWISLLVALVPFALVVYFWRALVRRRPVPEAQNV